MNQENNRHSFEDMQKEGYNPSWKNHQNFRWRNDNQARPSQTQSHQNNHGYQGSSNQTHNQNSTQQTPLYQPPHVRSFEEDMRQFIQSVVQQFQYVNQESWI